MGSNEYYKKHRDRILARAQVWYAENKHRKKDKLKNMEYQKAFLLAFLEKYSSPSVI